MIEVIQFQDDVLTAIADGDEISRLSLRSLPPWRAVMIARVALLAGRMTEGEVAELVAEAQEVGDFGRLRLPGS